MAKTNGGKSEHEHAVTASMTHAGVPSQHHARLLAIQPAVAAAGYNWLTILMLLKAAGEKAPEIISLLETIFGKTASKP